MREPKSLDARSRRTVAATSRWSRRGVYRGTPVAAIERQYARTRGRCLPGVRGTKVVASGQVADGEKERRCMSEVIDHVGIRVSDLATSRRMYEAALAELGFAVLGEGEFEGDAYVLFGRGTSDDFALHAVGTEPGRDRVTTGAHIAFRASDTVSVERWHAAAIDNGGTDNGAPGVRPEYSGRYHAAFALDPDGNNVEAVFHTPVRA
jgi:catechol 2,3-dioxygenase-like lactoylglutathione lyase family enzyme